MALDNVYNLFGGSKPIRQKKRLVSEVRNTKKPQSNFACATLAGNCFESFGFRKGDIVIFDRDSNDIGNGDLAIVNYQGQEVAFMVYFDGDNVILHGEKVEIFDRSKVEFVGRVVRMERDF